MEISEITLPGFKVAGIQTRANNEIEANPSKANFELYDKTINNKVEVFISIK